MRPRNDNPIYLVSQKICSVCCCLERSALACYSCDYHKTNTSHTHSPSVTVNNRREFARSTEKLS